MNTHMNTQLNPSSNHLLTQDIPEKSNPFGWLIRFSATLSKLFIAKFEQSELKVWQSNRNGQVYWHIYDSVTGQYAYLDSDAARSWIEKRYYL
jgi:hypothetical protein